MAAEEKKPIKVTVRTLIGLATMALVILVISLDTEKVSPGSLSLVHASDPTLQSLDSCSACHGGFLQSMTDACYECHEDIQEDVTNITGFHGQLQADVARDCAMCHSEHHGGGFSLVSERSFVEAGFASRESYDHSGLGYELEGIHTTLDCTECHEYAEARIVPIGSSRYMGLDQNCISCHVDEHEGEYGNDCRSCHGQTQAFSEVGGEAHMTFAPIVGGHASIECIACHEEQTPNSVHALALRHVAGDQSIPERTCQECHPTNHSEPFLDGVVDLAGAFGDQLSCQHCHSPEQAGFMGSEPQMTDELHVASGFDLELPHEQADCWECHISFDEREWHEDPAVRRPGFLEAYPQRDADTCSACHMDVHQGQFDESPFASQDCLGCHERTHFAPTAFDVEHHEQTEFALEGSHATTDCESCHELPAGQERITDEGFVPRQFAGTAKECSVCHEAPHREEFLENVRTMLFLVEDESCETCHTPLHETFLGDNAPMTDNPEIHAASGFALDIPHNEVSCADCHEGFGVRPEGPSEDDGLSAFLEVFPGRTAESCQECHTDPHVDQFEDGTFQSEDCLSCHADTGFHPPLFGFDHHEKTEFPLDGAHQAVSCNQCHEVPDGTADVTEEGLFTRVFKGTATDCESCHENVHEDYFVRPGLPTDVDGETGCARCHVTEAFETRRFEIFDHGLWAGYELEGAHRRADCDGCHVVERTTDPPRLTFGEVKGTDCVACHEDSHVGQFLVDGLTDCVRCHKPSETFADLVFDHQVDSRFPLDESHILLECSACHVPFPLSNGEEAIRYKPLGVERSDCHDPAGLQDTRRKTK